MSAELRVKSILLLSLATLLAAPVQAAPVQRPHIEVELIAEQTAWLPGAVNWVALRLKPEAGWHTYWRNPGDSGLPTRLAWTLPDGWSAGEIQWPYPQPHRLGDLTNYGYGEETLHLVALQAPPKIAAESVTVQALAKWLVCADICIPGEAELALSLPVGEIATRASDDAHAFEQARQRLPRAEPLVAGVFAVSGGEVHLRVDAGPAVAAGAQRAEFFAYANNLVNHGAPQRAAIQPDAVRFSQPLSAFFAAPAGAVDGVLVLHGDGARAYQVALTAGEVAALPAATTPAAAAHDPAEPSLALILLFALAGGLILNLMPCVFPVLAIKAVSVLESHRDERRHALAYAAGVILSCAAVAAVLIVLRAGGEALGWGFQLQSPLFIALLAYLMFALGLSLSGVAQFGTRFMGVGQTLTQQGGYAGSFFTGILATVVASPCTAPFMGVALGYALAQPAPLALLVFVTLGFGLALPFLLLGFFPRLAAWLPRPGAWMETFKQLMAFPLYLTVVWLLWVLGRQVDLDAIALALVGLTLVAFALWLGSAPRRGPLRALLAVAAFAGAVGLIADLEPDNTPAVAAQDAHTVVYSEARLGELRAAGQAVFVNVTADWCITCKANERIALNTEAVQQAFERHKVVQMTADWTTPDPAITALLERFARPGVPLYLLYPPRGEPQILPQLLAPDTVIDALAKIDELEK